MNEKYTISQIWSLTSQESEGFIINQLAHASTFFFFFAETVKNIKGGGSKLSGKRFLRQNIFRSFSPP